MEKKLRGPADGGRNRLLLPPRSAWTLVLALVMLAACAAKKTASLPPAQIRPVEEISNATSIGEGDYQARVLRERVLRDPTDLEARLKLARYYAAAGAPELAIEHYRLATERFPANAELAITLARALRDYGRSPEAIAALVNFCDRNEKPAPGLLSLLGILRDDAGEFTAAEQSYRAAIEEAPNRADLHNNLGYNLLLQDKPQDAAKEFEQALKIEPHSEYAHNNLGLALLAQWRDDSQPEEALLQWQSVSDPASAHNNLATVLMQQGRYADARKELEIALSYDQKNPAALENLKLLSELDGKSAEAPPPARISFWKRVKTVITASKPVSGVETASK